MAVRVNWRVNPDNLIAFHVQNHMIVKCTYIVFSTTLVNCTRQFIIHPSRFYSYWSICIAGIEKSCSVPCCFICSLIRDSAPLINIIIVCGCIVMLATSFLLGIDSKTPDTKTSMTQSGMIPRDVYGNQRFGIICNVSLSV